jgi:hypothetical protein
MALAYFGHQGLTLDALNLPEFIKGVERAKILQIRFMRGAFSRGGKQVRKAFIRDQLSGPPGIEGGQLKKGRNVFSMVYGDSPSSIGVKVGISRILHVHEKGMTIRPKAGGHLFLQKRGRGKRVLFQKGSKEDSTVLAVAEQVVIPKRLNFERQARSMGPAIVLKAAQESLRASEVAISSELKKFVGRI